MNLKNFSEKGYFISKATNIDPLIDLQSFLAESINSYSNNFNNLENEDALNKFHFYYSSQESKLNDVRMEIMNKINDSKQIKSLSSTVFDAFSDIISSLVGPDISAQKSTNLVIQPPESSFFSELHTDAPGNSEFELVVWVPMVNCYEGKSFYIIDKDNSFKLLNSYKKGEITSWKDFRQSSLKFANEVSVPFGHALFFWTGLLHGSFVNTSCETRWSFNTRFKNSFSPCGKKDPFQYFSPLKISDLTKLALDSFEN
tara:strand:- start:566 stop:1336 length:771 start_codon:yes stop_codon:yes gene_type:complete